MQEEQGFVTSLEGGGWAKVSVKAEGGGCAHCGSKSFCGASPGGEKVVKAMNRVEARVGDPVSIAIGTGAAKSAFVAYLIPLLAMIAGAIAGSFLGGKLGLDVNSGPVAFGFAGLFVGFGISALISMRMSKSRKSIPVITRVLNRNPADCH